MPELPEVETIRRQLNEVLVGKIIEDVKVLRDKSFAGDEKLLKGWVVEELKRKSKVIEIYFKNQEKIVIVHLKMTGQLIFLDKDRRIAGGHPTADWVKELPSSHTRVVWSFKDGSKLFFNDMRVFGWMKLVDKNNYLTEKRKSVPDVIDGEFDADYLHPILKRSSKAIKLVILDQDKIGGVGNIYANDALFLAKIRPTRKANDLSDKEIVDLVEAIKEVINKGIRYGGASAADDKYVNASGLGGKYQDHFLVYQRDGQLCKVCGNKIIKSRIGGRGTYYCEICQK